jgi:hypothetical protein
VIVASRIVGRSRTFATDDTVSAALLSAIPNASYAPIAGVDEPVTKAKARAALAARTGAMAVDMESHRVAELAAARGLPVVALRVVIDAAHRRVPPAALAFVSDGSGPRLLRLGRGLLGRPVDTVDFLRLCIDWVTTRRALGACCSAVESTRQALAL